MTFFGFFVLYRRRADITVDFIYDRLGKFGQVLVRQCVNAIVLVLMAVMIWHGPEIIERQAGIIEQVYLFGVQVERFTLSVPLFVTCVLIFLDYSLDVVFTLRGEEMPSLLRATRPSPQA
jgi:TRAP-type C4-dicarboxylate transport system permease small subunit